MLNDRHAVRNRSSMGLDVASGVVDGMVRKEAHTLHLGMCKLPVDCRCNKLPEACSNPLLDPVAETKHVLRHWPEAQQLLECSSCLPLCTFVLEEVSKIEDCGERALVVEGKDADVEGSLEGGGKNES